MRAEGVQNVGDRFLMKGIQQKIEAKKKADKKARATGEQVGRESYKSGQFFQRYNSVAQTDQDKKATKRHFATGGKADSDQH